MPYDSSRKATVKGTEMFEVYVNCTACGYENWVEDGEAFREDHTHPYSVEIEDVA